ncbi:MAG: phosphoribosylglycinamide formyltransferase [Elusimicrobiota bacterium]
MRIAVLVSGSGSNLQALIDGCRSGYIPGQIVLVVSSKPDVYALARAAKEKIDAVVIEKKNYEDETAFTEDMLKALDDKKVDLVCLAGYLLRIAPEIINAYRNRIINIHPALLPSYGGKGMYGLRVHEAVLAGGDKYTGCTVHFVDEKYDHGTIIMQEKVPVLEGDTPETLAERVLEEEHKLFPKAVRAFVLKEIKCNIE